MSSHLKLDLTAIEIRPFSNNTAVNRFDCGRNPINQFIKNKAKKTTRRLEQRVFCAHLGQSSVAIGYYALQVGADSVSELPGAKDIYLKNHIAFPAIHLSFLGVDEKYQRQGLGQYLLMDVFSKAKIISEHCGFYALTLQSLDEDATAFYESLGFRSYSTDARQPKMLYPLEDILTLVG